MALGLYSETKDKAVEYSLNIYIFVPVILFGNNCTNYTCIRFFWRNMDTGHSNVRVCRIRFFFREDECTQHQVPDQCFIAHYCRKDGG